MGWADSIIDFIYPPVCLRCGKPGKHPLCANCSQDMVPDVKSTAVSNFNLTTIYPYHGTGRDVMHLFKFDGYDCFARPLAEVASNYIFNMQPRVLVPVPVHFLRIRQRGFNQSAMIGWHIAKLLGWKCNGRLVRRARNTKPQFNLDIDERMSNIENSMAPYPFAKINPKQRYMIIDDIVTTGATLAECARVLRKMGAVHIDALAIFHAGSKETMLSAVIRR
ncbi:MAG: ComF family protein [Caldisericia bacterium]|nr:ComF family protein [Caldisericia bacterium]